MRQVAGVAGAIWPGATSMHRIAAPSPSPTGPFPGWGQDRPGQAGRRPSICAHRPFRTTGRSAWRGSRARLRSRVLLPGVGFTVSRGSSGRLTAAISLPRRSGPARASGRSSSGRSSPGNPVSFTNHALLPGPKLVTGREATCSRGPLPEPNRGTRGTPGPRSGRLRRRAQRRRRSPGRTAMAVQSSKHARRTRSTRTSKPAQARPCRGTKERAATGSHLGVGTAACSSASCIGSGTLTRHRRRRSCLQWIGWPNCRS